MSLAFLHKKSWHTSTLKNIEKRWIAEEKDKAEHRKMQELQKQLKEERQVMELKQLQQDAGLGKASAARVDWMYEGPAAAAQPSAEEYLLGKEYKDTGPAANNDVKELAEAAASKPGSLWLSKTTAANESFRRRTEDPLVAIKLREKAARERILANPMRMQAIRQAARAKQMGKRKAAKKAKKAAKKEKKRLKKEMKAAKRATRAQDGGADARSDRRRSRRSRSSSSSSDDDAPRSRATKASAPAPTPAPAPAPAPSTSAPRATTRWGNALPSSGATGDAPSSGVRDKGRDGSGGNHDGRGSSGDRHGRAERRSSHGRRDDSRGRDRRSRSPRHGQRRGRPRSRSPHGGRPASSSRGGRDASRSRRRGGSRSRSRSRSPGRRRDDGRGRGSHSHSRRPRSRSKSRSRSPVRRRRIGDPSPERAPEGAGVDKRAAASQASATAPPVFDKRKYGLQRGKLPSSGTGPRRLGPSEEMLAKRMKFKEEQEKKQATTAKAVLQAASRRAPLTAEERQRKLLEMQAAADAHDARIAADARMAKVLDAEDNNDEGQSNVAPHFIKQITGSVLNDVSVTERIRGKKHTNQRNSDPSSFLKRG